MHWHRIGRIFDPAEHGLPPGCVGFAQSPQALVFDDYVRIYFSTRSVDGNGKFVSHVAFVDMSTNLEQVLRVADSPVIAPGGLGCFDEHGIFPMNVLRVGDEVWGYTTGWNRRVSVSVDTAIGLAISGDDGKNFVRVGDGPVLSASLHEPCLVGDAFVRHIGQRFHMWYIFGTGWKRYDATSAPDRTYKIGHATSEDGLRWTTEGGRPIVADALGAEESQALPTVIEVDGVFHMFFCFRHSYDFRSNVARGYRIGHAWSRDLVEWTRDDTSPALHGIPGEWDGDMQCYPHVFDCDGRVLMLYNGNEFGRHGFGVAELRR
ncbi:MAG: hypothetical protein ABIX12_07200 [Rubrivivax sp.]